MNKKNIVLHSYMLLTIVGILCFLPVYEISILIGSNSVVLAFLHAVGSDSMFRVYFMLTWVFGYSVFLFIAYILGIKKEKYRIFVFAVALNSFAMLFFTILKVIEKNDIELVICIIGTILDFSLLLWLWKLLLKPYHKQTI